MSPSKAAMLIGAPAPGGGGGARPAVEDADTQKASQSSASNSWGLTYPTNMAADDILMGILGQSNQFVSATWPGGWTQMVQHAGSGQRFHVAWLRAAGSESGAFNVTFNSTVSGSWLIYRISGADPLVNPESGGGATETGTTAGPNPGVLTPSWGPAETLWLPIFSMTPSAYDLSTEPTDYSNGETQRAASPIVGVARRHLNASSENAGAFTMTNGANNISWVARMFAVKAA